VLWYDEQQIRMTVSAGVATCSSDIDGPDMVLKLADAALYEAKTRSRNCVVVYDQVN